MLEAIRYLFETYVHAAPEIAVNQGKLAEDLTRGGFKRNDIYNAFDWLETRAIMQESVVSSFSDLQAMRIYNQ